MAEEKKSRSEIAPKGAWLEWMSLKSVAAYADVSERTLREWMHSPDNPLPYSQRGGTILISRREFDGWMQQHSVKVTHMDIEQIVNEIVSDLKAK